MSRNRFRQNQSLPWMVVVKYILVVGLLSFLGLSYLLCKNHILRIASETAEKEKELTSLLERNQQLMADINRLKSPAWLEKRVQEFAQVNGDSHLVLLVELPHVRMDSGAGARLARGYSPSLY